MFNKPFSTTGRIRRLELGLTCIVSSFIGIFSYVIIGVGMEGQALAAVLLGYAVYFVNCWFGIAQCAKRCHDLGHSGWMQLVPFFNPFCLLFQDGTPGANEYGPNPKTGAGVQRPVQEPVQREYNAPGAYEQRPVAPSMQTQHMNVGVSQGTIIGAGQPEASGRLTDGNGMTYPLRSGINTIGRRDASSYATTQISTDDRYMSRNHAVIEVSGYGPGLMCVLRFGDNSQVPIVLNGMPLSPGQSVRLSNGDRITLGHTELTFWM